MQSALVKWKYRESVLKAVASSTGKNLKVRCLVRAEKRRKAGSNFAAGSGCGRKQNVQQTRKASCRNGKPTVQSRLEKVKPTLLTILQLELCVLQSI
ncbi:hypothetical protein SLEP1_g54761 [Rubroshorea leprosula]|uniref:Uncharacterized protein n=1 Tax=Rubroshorea leprosula TaxID=152421 RepID=A0AAV5MDK9_9ROSI|nr:hypothetical protein SLEP1_g54761 [Rubroshorea leprosula]